MTRVKYWDQIVGRQGRGSKMLFNKIIVPKLNRLDQVESDIKFYKLELIEAGIYKVNPPMVGCNCPKFYKDTGPLAGLSYNCIIHGR